MSPPRIVIVGAGLSGLSLAFRLQQRLPAAEVQVIDSAPRSGGTIATKIQSGYTVELGPNGFLDSKPTTLQLARDLGLASRLVPASESAGKDRFLFLGTKLERLPGSPGDLLKTPLLSWRGKLSFLMERVRRRGSLADESIDAFARRRAGPEVADVFANALVTGIFAGDPAKLSLPACFPRVAQFERDHGSVLKGFAHAAGVRRREAEARGEAPAKPKLWSFDGGLSVLTDALTAALRKPIVTGAAVRAIERGWTIRADGVSWSADAVVLACPAHQQATVVRNLDAMLADEMAAIPYNRVAVVALGYRRNDVPGGANGFGFIAPERLGRDVLGVQWCSSIYPGRAPDGAVLMRAMCGGSRRGEMVDWDDDRLLAAVRAELRIIQKIEAAPVFHTIQRWDAAIPQYHVGHLARLERIDQMLAPHPGLYLAGNAYRGVAMNDCTEQAEILADRISRAVSSPTN